MFLPTYKNAVKTILRSVLFWITFAALIVTVVSSSFDTVSYTAGHESTLLSISAYQKHLHNLFGSSFLIYAMPLFAVIVTVLVLNRDYGDQFYEIEKAAGVKSLQYLFGRLCAILSILLVVQALTADVLLHIYVVGWGGVEGMSLGTYLVNSTVRLLMLVFGLSLPCMLFYVGLTYMIGALFHSGFVGSFGGFGYVILYYILLSFKVYFIYLKNNATMKFYFEYLCPIPDKLHNYLYCVGWEDERMMMVMLDTSLIKAAVCICIIVSFFSVFTAIAYLRIRRRET